MVPTSLIVTDFTYQYGAKVRLGWCSNNGSVTSCGLGVVNCRELNGFGYDSLFLSRDPVASQPPPTKKTFGTFPETNTLPPT